MWLLNVHTRRLEDFQGDKTPKYAILSHRWEFEEVSFKDITKRSPEHMLGYYKIDMCCKEALMDDLSYVWVDTCCIDKRSSAELSEAINSMFHWYKNASVCYAFLSDVCISTEEGDQAKETVPFIQSAWFTRGWTLQELLAPRRLIFFDREWQRIGSKEDDKLGPQIYQATTITREALRFFEPRSFSIVRRMSWAAHRQTTREEDKAYSLLGIFDINMPLLYGEGSKAFHRLQEEIIKVSNDRSIFCWWGPSSPLCGMFALSPSGFAPSAREERRFVSFDKPLTNQAIDYGLSNAGMSMKMDLQPFYPRIYIAWIPYSVGTGTFVFGIYLQQIMGQIHKGIFRRVRVRGSTLAETQIESYEDLTVTRAVSLTVAREPAEDFSVPVSFSFRCCSFSVACVTALNQESLDNWSYSCADGREVSVSVDPSEAHGLLGIFHGLNRHSELVIVTVGLDFESNPICIVEKWPEQVSEQASKFFGFDMDNMSSRQGLSHSLRLRGLSIIEQLLSRPAPKVDTMGSNILTIFVGMRDTFSYFTQYHTTFSLEDRTDGFDLSIQSHSTSSDVLSEKCVRGSCRHLFSKPILWHRNYFENLLTSLKYISDET